MKMLTLITKIKILSVVLVICFSFSNIYSQEVIYTPNTINYYIYDNNKLAILDYESVMESNIFLKDISTGTVEEMPYYTRGSRPYFAIFHYNSNRIAYVNYTINESWYVDLYDLSSGSSSRLNQVPETYKETIWINGDIVTYTDYRTGDISDIFYYSLSDNREVRVTQNQHYNSKASTDANSIVFVESENGVSANIVYYDINSQNSVKPSPGDFHQDNPRVSGNYIVWEDYRRYSQENEIADIYLYNISTDESIVISTGDAVSINPYMQGNIVVWEDYRHSSDNPDIYLYDISEGVERRITHQEGFFNGYPITDGEHVTWLHIDNSDNMSIYRLAVSQTSTKEDIIDVAEKITIYPNPFNPIVNIDISGFNLLEVEQMYITDITGKKVYEFNESEIGNRIVWNPGKDKLSSGVYFLNVLGNKRLSTKKMIFMK